MTTPLAPEDNIGPYYRVVGAVLLLVFVVIIVGLVTPLIVKGSLPTDVTVVKVLAGLAVVDFAGFFFVVARPARFDAIFRMVIAAIPWTKYGSTPTGGSSS